jgi:hypothetical protein
MARFTQPLYERQANAAVKRRRYRSDPAFRLLRINRARVHLGLPPRASLDDAQLRVPMEVE